MDKELFNYIKSFGFEDEDVEDFCSREPALEIIDCSRAKACVEAVVEAGYPRIDIDGLIFTNPGFLTNDPRDLKIKLITLGANIEEKLKEDPFLI